MAYHACYGVSITNLGNILVPIVLLVRIYIGGTIPILKLSLSPEVNDLTANNNHRELCINADISQVTEHQSASHKTKLH